MKRIYTIFLSLINVISSALLILIAFVTRYFINYVDDTLSDGKNCEKSIVLICVFILLGTILIQILLRGVYLVIKAKCLLYLDVTFKKKLQSRLLDKDLQELNTYHSGEITNIYLNDVKHVEDFLTSTIPGVFSSSSRFIFSLIALIIIDWKFLLLLFVLGLCASLIGIVYTKKMKKHAKICLESDGKVTSFIQESLENIKIIKAFEVEDNVNKELSNRLNDNYNKKKKKYRFSIIGFTGIYGLMNFSYVLCLAYGGYAIAFLGLAFGDLSALLQLVSYLEGPLSDFSSYLNSYANYKASKERINKLISLKEEQVEETIDDFESIVFDHVTFYYEKNKPVIEDFSLEIKKEDVAIFKGESGRGKTTLFMMILGFIKPISGKAYIKYKDKEIPFSKATRKFFSYVPQDNIIFSGTIRDNFKLLSSCEDEKLIYDALDKACLLDDINKMPLKLDTPLKERGQGLSTGQIQRILIAISLLNNKEVLLLDEFTSSLDMKTEQEIVLSLSSLKKTIIMISHRKIEIDNYKEINI